LKEEVWHNDVNLHILSHNKMLINFYILGCLNNDKWFATGLYGHPTHDKKYLTSDTIMQLYNSRLNDKYILFGDFNMYLNSYEKLGGKHVDYNLCNKFQYSLNQGGLNDLGYHGNKYTWANKQEIEHHIKERVDIFCAN